jgi:methyl-accepting chemotaxis protein
MRGFSIRWRLGLGFGLASAILLLTILMGYIQLSRISQAVGQTTDSYQILLTAEQAIRALATVEAEQRGHLTTGRQDYLTRLEQQGEAFLGALDRLGQLTAHSTSQQERLPLLRERFISWKQNELQAGIQAHRNGAFQSELNELLLAAIQKMDALRTMLSEVAAEEAAVLEVRIEEQARRERLAERVLLIGALAGLLTGVLVAWTVMRTIGGAIRDAVELVSAVAQGDLTQQVQRRRRDEFGELQRAMAAMIRQLQEMIARITDASSKLAAAAEQMSVTAARTLERSSQQQDESTQAAAAMHQMTSTVQEIARSTQETADVARDSGAEAEQGKLIVGKTIDDIDQLAQEVRNASEVIRTLHDDSGRISQVLDVIRGIAEQTNLLALNAAIEAARAGEHGRGFAVVADEVRTLATGTQRSIGDIEEMIGGVQAGAQRAVKVMEGSRAQVDSSVERAAAAGERLEHIVAAVTRIQDMAAQVASAVEEQSMVAESVNRNVVSVKDMASDTGREIREVGEAAQTLTELARQLQATVERFRVN